MPLSIALAPVPVAFAAFAAAEAGDKCTPGIVAVESPQAESRAICSRRDCIRFVESSLERLAIAVAVGGPWAVLLVVVPPLRLEEVRRRGRIGEGRIAILGRLVVFRLFL